MTDEEHLLVHRWDGDHAPTLLRAVRPLADRARATGLEVGYDVGWVRGPHVRCRVAPAVGSSAQSAVDLDEWVTVEVRGHLGPFVHDRTPSAGVDPGDSRPLHEQLARFERVEEPLWPWIPDGTVTRLRRPRPEGLDAVTSAFHARTLDLDLDLVAQGLDRTRLLQHAFDLLVVVADGFSDGSVLSGYVSFRSHAEAYLAQDASGRLRTAWGEHAERVRGPLSRRLTEVLTHGSPAPAAAVTAVLRPLVQDHGALLVPPADAPADATPTPSPFHARLARNERWQTETATSEWFARYRMALNLTYLHLTKHGLTPHERFLVCFLVADVVEAVFEVDADELLSQRSRG